MSQTTIIFNLKGTASMIFFKDGFIINSLNPNKFHSLSDIYEYTDSIKDDDLDILRSMVSTYYLTGKTNNGITGSVEAPSAEELEEHPRSESLLLLSREELRDEFVKLIIETSKYGPKIRKKFQNKRGKVFRDFITSSRNTTSNIDFTKKLLEVMVENIESPMKWIPFRRATGFQVFYTIYSNDKLIDYTTSSEDIDDELIAAVESRGDKIPYTLIPAGITGEDILNTIGIITGLKEVSIPNYSLVFIEHSKIMPYVLAAYGLSHNITHRLLESTPSLTVFYNSGRAIYLKAEIDEVIRNKAKTSLLIK